MRNIHSIGKSSLSARSMLLWLCLGQLVVWSVASILLHHTAPLDVVEAIAWGSQWQWGYDRDPYLVAWLAKSATMLAGGGVWPVFILSQCCIVATFAAVWRFAKYLRLTDAHALLAVIFLLGSFYYHFTSPEFNDNVLQLPLWAWSQYWVYRAINEQRIVAWLWFGVMIALALMAKYFALMLLIPIVAYLLLSQKGRRSFKRPGIYLAALIAAVIVAPNIIWQRQNDWQYIHYALSRAQVAPSFFNHFKYPLKFFLSQMLAIGPAIFIYLLSTHRKRRAQPAPALLWLLALGPFFTLLTYCMISGSQMRSMWGTPLFSLVGLLIVVMTMPELSVREWRRTIGFYLAYAVFGFFAFIGSILLPPYLFGYAKHAHFPSKVVAKYAEKVWADNTDKPFKYVVGDRRLSARVAVYSKKHPVPYFELNPNMSAWIDESAIQKNGAIFIWDVKKSGEKMPGIISGKFPKAQSLSVKQFAWVTRANVLPVKVGYAILLPNR